MNRGLTRKTHFSAPNYDRFGCHGRRFDDLFRQIATLRKDELEVLLLICSIQMLSQFQQSLTLFCFALFTFCSFVCLLQFISFCSSNFFHRIFQEHPRISQLEWTHITQSCRETYTLSVCFSFRSPSFIHFIRFSFSSMPRNVHSPLIPTPAQCESHEKRALAFALPLLSHTLQKIYFCLNSSR